MTTGTEMGSPLTISDIVDKKDLNVENGKKGKDAEEKKNKKFTCKQKISLAILALVDLMSFCSMSIMAPFYPQEAAKKGMSDAMSACVFGFYALVVFLSAPVFGKILPRIGLNLLFHGGVFLSGLCSLVFGTLDMIDDYHLFTVLSFVIRGLEALGASAYSTASYVTIVNVFPDHAGAVRGFLEIFVGLGMSVGPAIGGVLFVMGGFSLPFYGMGVVILLIAPLSLYFLPSSENRMTQTKSGSFVRVLKITPVIVTCFILIVVAMTWSFLDPTLEPHLRKFHLSPTAIGGIFLLVSATYGISSPGWGWLSDRIRNYWWIMTLGLFLNSLTLLALGPSPMLPFKDSIELNIVSLACLGVSVSMGLIPSYQSLLDSALEAGFVENLGTHSVIAGLWSSVYSLGEVLGPVLGGNLLQNYNFPVTATVFAILNFITSVLSTIYFLQRRKPLSPEEVFSEQLKAETYKNKTFEVPAAILRVECGARDFETWLKELENMTRANYTNATNEYDSCQEVALAVTHCLQSYMAQR